MGLVGVVVAATAVMVVGVVAGGAVDRNWVLSRWSSYRMTTADAWASPCPRVIEACSTKDRCGATEA
jgi:hypothetical protein